MAVARINRRSGRVVLTTPQRARVLEHTTEAHADAAAVSKALFEAVQILVAAHSKVTAGGREITAANRIICAARYEPDESPVSEASTGWVAA